MASKLSFRIVLFLSLSLFLCTSCARNGIFHGKTHQKNEIAQAPSECVQLLKPHPNGKGVVYEISCADGPLNRIGNKLSVNLLNTSTGKIHGEVRQTLGSSNKIEVPFAGPLPAGKYMVQAEFRRGHRVTARRVSFVYCFGGKSVRGRSDGKSPLFSFAALADIHVAASKVQHADSLTVNTEKIVAEINSSAKFPTPDFVVVAGDLAHVVERIFALQKGEKPPVDHDLSLAKQVLDKLKVPCYPIAGNHDISDGLIPMAGDMPPEPFGSVYGKKYFNYTVDKSGYRFIFMGYINKFRSPDALKAQKAWLSKQLDASAGMPVIIVVHSPLVTPRRGGDMANWMFNDLYDKLLAKYSDRIVAVFDGK